MSRHGCQIENVCVQHLKFGCYADTVFWTKHRALEVHNNPKCGRRYCHIQGQSSKRCSAPAFRRLQMLHGVLDIHARKQCQRDWLWVQL